ncbi:hypothetical protein AWB82_07288 [Caballeronia glebae]|uniref:Uncharacterized protein n=1 Tax=Caballeronia glebae TaxID=1777143 RepID=A0A158DY22_9BURK|nr:hypothetical protein AWB82_07288 [Caballeronia glebae]
MLSSFASDSTQSPVTVRCSLASSIAFGMRSSHAARVNTPGTVAVVLKSPRLGWSPKSVASVMGGYFGFASSMICW